ncbi:MAG TPA: dockerin type I domain-containing protein, partial [Thermoguttaceae bacterium]|nr:dockerin type I domain-containing protein [Thermoguttaceae bacterium]
LPTLESGLLWETGDLYVSGTLAVVSASSVPGDANRDGHVDTVDAHALAAHWGQSGGWTDGDFNDDGVVNALDASILAAYWSPAPPMESSDPTGAVPEPGTVALLLGLGAMALLRGARDRNR